LKKSTSLSNDDDINVQNKTLTRPVFKNEWLDVSNFKLWLREVPDNESVCFCAICDKSFTARLSQIRRHAESQNHLNTCKRKGIETSEVNDDINTDDEDEALLTFDARKKTAEIQFAALIAEKNIPFQTAQDILNFFQEIGQEPKVLKNMNMGRTKCSNIISNVLCPVEIERVVNKLQRTKFSIFIDEASDICNEKWMILFVRYVDPETLDIRSQLLKLINIDTGDSNADNLFHTFQCEMKKLQIPFSNIIALSCDNTPVMTGKHLSFETKLRGMCKYLLTFPCPCHSSALAAHAACAKIPSFCERFLKKIVNYINRINHSKHSATFNEFSDCFQETYRKILKLSDTRWISHYICVERLLESWHTIQYFLQEMIASDKTKSAEHLLSMMENAEMKAYFLFVKHILYLFNEFSVFFQSTETRIHFLQIKSVNFLFQVCQNFIKKDYLKDIATNINFAQKKIQKDTNEIFLGSECEEYLNNLMIEGHIDTITTIRQNCLQFYIVAAQEIRKRLPITNDFLNNLQVFGASMSLLDDNRETSFHHVSFVARNLGGFDEEYLKEEWFTLPTDFTTEEKKSMAALNFDDMWKAIVQRQLPNSIYKYPNLRNILNAVRSFPNSNADPERMFSILTELKSNTRNKLSSTCVNATCVLKSALKNR
ncbi:General transcription factor II-I repeat domain-containing protein, partial [Ooceraea biroi]